MSPVEYAQAGHIYCGIELYEGAALAASINEILGDGVLMFSSDYPHNQAEFPRSPDIVLEWEDRLGSRRHDQTDVEQRRAVPPAVTAGPLRH